AYTLIVVTVGWVILRAGTFGAAVTILKAMAGANGIGWTAAERYLTLPLSSALIVALVGAGPMIPSISRWRVSIDAFTVAVLMMGTSVCLFLWRGAAAVLNVGRVRKDPP